METPTIHINVKRLDGPPFGITHLNPSSTVLSLKESIFSQEGVPIETQRIIYKGRVLQDREKLADKGILTDTDLFLTTKRPPSTSASPNTQQTTAPAQGSFELVVYPVLPLGEAATLGSFSISDTPISQSTEQTSLPSSWFENAMHVFTHVLSEIRQSQCTAVSLSRSRIDTDIFNLSVRLKILMATLLNSPQNICSSFVPSTENSDTTEKIVKIVDMLRTITNLLSENLATLANNIRQPNNIAIFRKISIIFEQVTQISRMLSSLIYWLGNPTPDNQTTPDVSTINSVLGFFTPENTETVINGDMSPLDRRFFVLDEWCSLIPLIEGQDRYLEAAKRLWTFWNCYRPAGTNDDTQTPATDSLLRVFGDFFRSISEKHEALRNSPTTEQDSTVRTIFTTLIKDISGWSMATRNGHFLLRKLFHGLLSTIPTESTPEREDDLLKKLLKHGSQLNNNRKRREGENSEEKKRKI